MKQLKAAYINYRWIKVAALAGIVLSGVLFLSVSGGFPPWAWRFLFHVLTQFQPLWAAQRGALVLPLFGLCMLSLALLIIWAILLVLGVKIIVSCWSDFTTQQRINDELLEAERLSEEQFADVVFGDEEQFEQFEIPSDESRYTPRRRSLTQASAPPQQMYSEQGASYIVGGVRRSRQLVPPAAYVANGGPVSPSLPVERRNVQPQEQAAWNTPVSFQRSPAPAVQRPTTSKRLHIVPPPQDNEPDSEDLWWNEIDSRDDPDLLPLRDNQQASARQVPQLSWDGEPVRPITSSRRQVPDLKEIEEHPTVPGKREEREPEPDMVSSGMPTRLVVGIGLDPGIARRDAPNEDSIFAIQGVRMTESGPVPAGLFVVADGMGGHANGREASRMAVRAISDIIVPALLRDAGTMGAEDEETLFRDLLRDGVHRANIAIHARNKELPNMMGTTLTAALIVDRTAYIANVGDSRTYLYSSRSGLKQVTRDHSTVARLVERELITPDEIYTHPQRNQIYRCLGERASVEMDTFVQDLQPDDLLLLCSDGLWEMVRDPVIEKAIARCAHNPAQASTLLVQSALSGGGADNISVVVVGIVRSEV